MSSPASQLEIAEIRNRLAERVAEPYIHPNKDRFVPGAPRPAAVLIPLLRKHGKWELLFIRRSTVDGDHHSGQVAFPGGRMDSQDASAEETALRETQEEVGLAPDEVQILGRLEHMVTISNYKLTPVVGVIPWPSKLRPAPSEVQRIFTIPMEWLADPSHYELKERRVSEKGGAYPVIYFQPYDGELLWGVSAHITLNFLEALDLI